MISVHGMTDGSNFRYILGTKANYRYDDDGRGGDDDDDDDKLGVRGGWNWISFFHQ
jgi:hypothetical protein